MKVRGDVKPDIRVEATAIDAGASVTALKVTVDGIDVTSRGVLTTGSGNLRRIVLDVDRSPLGPEPDQRELDTYCGTALIQP